MFPRTCFLSPLGQDEHCGRTEEDLDVLAGGTPSCCDDAVIDFFLAESCLENLSRCTDRLRVSEHIFWSSDLN